MARRRRGQGEGSIYKRADGHWTASVQVAVDENGKRHRRTVYGRTRAEVVAKLDDLRSRVAEGVVADPGRLTVGGFFAQWLRDTARLRLRPSTHSLYSDLVRLHIGPRLGGVLLKALQPAHVTALLSAMERDGKAPRLRQMVYTLLHSALRDAVKTGLLARNPAAAVDRPRVPRKEIRALDPAQVRTLLDQARGDSLEALYVLAVASGLRLGELLGLQWGDLDLDAGVLHVQRTLVEAAHTGALTLAEPKTARSRRRVDLPAFAVAALRAHRTRLGAVPHRERLVFTDRRGGPLRRSNLHRRSFKPLLRRAKHPEATRFHDLRHTAASLALATGTHAKVVQEQLGHASIATTLDTYSHTIPSMGREAAERLDTLLAEAQ